MFKRLCAVVLILTSFCIADLYAQPGGPGGRPPGGGWGGGRPGGRPGQRPRDDGGFSNQPNDQRAHTIKQKKAREGSTFKVVGSLRDSTTNEFLAYLNVAVLDTADSSMVKGGTSNLDGLFELSGIHAGHYLLRISGVGYKTLYHPFTVENNTALGTILLHPATTLMKEVTVTAEKPLYAMDGEKMIYNVSEDPSIQTGTTSDALQNAPGVEVDIEGNITLRGVSSVEIWINDKPSKLTSENLKTYLETLPANALDRIEAISNPSAKYATEAEAVINIVTSAHIKKNHFISFGAFGSPQPSVNPWVSYMWANEKLSVNIYASARYNRNRSLSENISAKRRDGSAPGTYDTLMTDSSYAVSSSTGIGGNLFMNLSYNIDSTSDIEFYGSVNYNHSRSESDLFDTCADYTKTPLSPYTYGDTNTSRSNNWFGFVGGNYTKKKSTKALTYTVKDNHAGIYKTVQSGSASFEAALCQAYLIGLGYMTGTPKKKADVNLTNAIVAFQKANSLGVTKKCDKATWKKLVAAVKGKKLTKYDYSFKASAAVAVRAPSFFSTWRILPSVPLPVRGVPTRQG